MIRDAVESDSHAIADIYKKLSAQWEHTVAVTSCGFEVLTLRDEERTQAGVNL